MRALKDITQLCYKITLAKVRVKFTIRYHLIVNDACSSGEGIQVKSEERIKYRGVNQISSGLDTELLDIE